MLHQGLLSKGLRAGRDGEAVAMPLKHRKALGQMRQPGAGCRLIKTPKRLPATFGEGHAADLSAQRLGQQLAAQAVADQRNITANKVLQRSHFRLDPGQRIIQAHWPAHDGHGLGAVEVDAIQLAEVGAQHA